MAHFTYTARNADGQRVTGRVAGPSAQAVLGELVARDLAPIEVDEIREGGLGQRRRVGVRAMSTAYRQLADLIRAGVPLLRALRLLGRSKSNPRLATVMARVAESVSEGENLADAMATHPEVYADIQVAMVRAGERGGFLEDVLTRMGNFLEAQAEMRGKVLGSLIYPAVLVAVMVSVIVLALTVLVPQFESFYANMDLPLPTKILLGMSAFLTQYWLVAIGVVVATVFGVRWLRRQPEFQVGWARFLLRVPRVGVLVRDLAVGRFARILGTMIENGIPMLVALRISKDAAGNVVLAEAIENATEAVRTGEPLSDPLQASGLFSDEVVEVIRVGESANNLDVVLSTLADTLEKRIDRQLTAAVRLIEPAILLVMGVAVFFLFGALVVPMLQMSSQV